MAIQDHYALLGLTKKASASDIRKAYRRLVLQCHPDRNPGDPAAEARFKQLTDAYTVLSSPEKKSQYDGVLNAFQDALLERQASQHEERVNQLKRRMAEAESRGGKKSHQISDRWDSKSVDALDGLFGMVFGAVAASGLGIWFSDTGMQSLPIGLIFPCVVGPATFFLGKWIASAAEPVFEVFIESWPSLAPVPDLLPLGVSGLGVWVSAGFGLPAENVGLLLWPGMISAGAAGALGAPLGRAFTSVATERVEKIAGWAVSLASGGLIGGFIGLLLTTCTLVGGITPTFFDVLFVGGASGAAGGALACLLGSFRNLRSEPF